MEKYVQTEKQKIKETRNAVAYIIYIRILMTYYYSAWIYWRFKNYIEKVGIGLRIRTYIYTLYILSISRVKTIRIVAFSWLHFTDVEWKPVWSILPQECRFPNFRISCRLSHQRYFDETFIPIVFQILQLVGITISRYTMKIRVTEFFLTTW